VGAASLELSIIIPVFNEEASLGSIFGMLSRQREVIFEVLLADGGSTDGTTARAASLALASPFPCRLLSCERGRGRQLNVGARAATAEMLLFLHADSEFPDSLALRKGLDALVASGDMRVAGRYALRFVLPAARYDFGYYFYECKARLDRPECTHGDQGFLLRRSFFSEIGPFDESFPLLEDTRLAERVRREGRGLLLPSEILTSARRFETEGLCERQLLNALIMNFAAIGWDEFFRVVFGIYRSQDLARRLQLLPIFRAIRELLQQSPWRQRFALWQRTGAYVRPNAWQLIFALDTHRNFRRGLPPGEGETPLLEWFDRWYGPITDHPPGRLAAAALVWLWFQLTLLWLRFREEEESSGSSPAN